MTTLSVPDMSCGHCQSSVEAALSALPGAEAVVVDLAHRQVRVKGPAAPEALLAALSMVGFPAAVLAD
jgi:copper chaperone